MLALLLAFAGSAVAQTGPMTCNISGVVGNTSGWCCICGSWSCVGATACIRRVPLHAAADSPLRAGAQDLAAGLQLRVRPALREQVHAVLHERHKTAAAAATTRCRAECDVRGIQRRLD
jgi:hypothetical protein